MKRAGVDIGSRYIKYALLDGDHLREFYKEETGHDPLKTCRALIEQTKPDSIIATGYGRGLLEVHGDIKTITEIKAVARGAREIFPSCRTIIDIGGQDTKVVSLDESGLVAGFEMNDRCAAGTGRFIEVMAKALGYSLPEFGNHCELDDSVKVNSMCTVFAESEVIGLIAKGVRREVIASALQNSIVGKIMPLLKRIQVKDDIAFAGGCAHSASLKQLFEERLQSKLLISAMPDMLSALGAALYAK